MTGLTGKVALVTGGSRGIGAAVAERLAGRGATVAITYAAAAEKAEAVAKRIEAQGGQVLVVKADHRHPDAPAAAVNEVATVLGRLDILVNNAGIYAGGPLDELTVAQVDEVLAVDVRAVLLAAQAAARCMGPGSRIITVGSSLAERVPGPTFTLYAMSKSALVGLTKGLARDLAPRGIAVTLVQPGPIDTDMNPQDGPAAQILSQVTAMGHYGTVEDVASAVDYLAGDSARYITGASLTVDGDSQLNPLGVAPGPLAWLCEQPASARWRGAQASRRPAPGTDRQPDGARCLEGHYASGPQRVHLLGRRCQAGDDARTPHSPDPGGAGGRAASALLLAGVRAPRAQRQIATDGRRSVVRAKICIHFC
jgi:3-oxoacyl-[acyl-carrier protein] reductase